MGSVGTRGTRRAARWLATVAMLLATALALTASGQAGPSLVITVRLVPATVSAGQPALAVVTFDNRSPSTLTNSSVTMHFPKQISPGRAPGCKSFSVNGSTVVCHFGDVSKHTIAHAYVTSRVTPKVPDRQPLTVRFAVRVGPGVPEPILTSVSTTALASSNGANRGTCLAKPRALSATLAEQTTALPAPPSAASSLHLPCTPLSVGVAPGPRTGPYRTEIASVAAPALKHPTIVKLTFPDEKLPDEQWISNLPPGTHLRLDNPNPLWTFPGETPSTKAVVPHCLKGPKLPKGWHSCVVSVIANDPVDNDYDAGTINLLVQGGGFGDPRYIG
jgi:hypothetical protein